MDSGFRAGDIVEIRSLEEILATLDSDGTLEGMPYMPEMVEFCGKRFRIFQRVIQSVIDTAGLSEFGEAHVRSFKGMDVYVLKNNRCSGENHGGCQRGCKIFWKEAWLKNVGKEHLAKIEIYKSSYTDEKLKTFSEGGKYYCQSTQFYNSTINLSKSKRFYNIVLNLWYGNYGLISLLRILSIWSFWKLFNKMFGDFPKGNLKKTPEEVLNLQPDEIVEVKSLKEVKQTLNQNGRNKGLHFSPDMIKHCGKRYSVRNRVDKIIFEATGEMHNISNTVFLEGVYADSAYYAFGGCPREDFAYWREIWLKRVNEQEAN